MGINGNNDNSTENIWYEFCARFVFVFVLWAPYHHLQHGKLERTFILSTPYCFCGIRNLLCKLVLLLWLAHCQYSFRFIQFSHSFGRFGRSVCMFTIFHEFIARKWWTATENDWEIKILKIERIVRNKKTEIDSHTNTFQAVYIRSTQTGEWFAPLFFAAIKIVENTRSLCIMYNNNNYYNSRCCFFLFQYFSNRIEESVFLVEHSLSHFNIFNTLFIFLSNKHQKQQWAARIKFLVCHPKKKQLSVSCIRVDEICWI